MVICSGSLGNKYISFVFQSQYRSTWSLNSWLLIDSSLPGWCLVAKSCPALWDPMNCSIPGFPVLHYLLNLLKLMSVESIMPSNHLICHPFLLLPSIFPSIRAFSKESAVCIRWPKYWASTSVLPMNIQGWFPLGLTGLILLSMGLSRVFSNFIVPKHQFFGTQPSLQSNSQSVHNYWKNHRFDYTDLCQQSDVSAFEYAV